MTPFATVKHALAVAGLAAIALTGCSGTPNTPALAPAAPGFASNARPAAMRIERIVQIMKQGLSPAKLLELQLDGTLPAPVPQAVLRAQYRQLGQPRPQLAFNSNANAAVSLWTANTNFNYILGQDKGGTRTETAIDSSQSHCYSPVALKVDRGQNVWVACELTSPSSTTGVLNLYAPDGTLKSQYYAACPRNKLHCQSYMGYGWDSGLDGRGDVFASQNLYSITICNPSCNSKLGAGFEWWRRGAPKAKPRLISVGANCAPICGVGFMDVDTSGNLWFDFAGYNASNVYGFGLGEVTNPTTNPKLTIVEPIGTYKFFGGVYISNGGKTLNVIDQALRTVSQYKMPLKTGAKPFNVIGPTQQTAFGVGTPVSGGFDKDDSKIAIGDAGGWIDVGQIGPNKWSARANKNFYSGVEGAAFTPSDK